MSSVAVGQRTEKTLQFGASQVVNVCMGVKPGEKVFVITDNSRASIGSAIFHKAIEAVGNTDNVKLAFLEDYDQQRGTLDSSLRRGVPEQLKKDLMDFKPDVVIFAAGGQEGELNFRIPLITELLMKELKVRYGHMINVTEQIMTEAMCVDYANVAEMSKKVFDAVKGAKHLRVTSPEGTDLEFDLNPDPQWTDKEGKKHNRWVNSDGIIHEQGKWSNLPDGEVFTSPMSVNGTMVITGVLGDHFDQKYGPLKHPITVNIKNSVADVDSISCEDRELETEYKEYLKKQKNSDRVGELGIGTNVALEKPIGNMLQDEKIPGVHVAFGNPYPDTTGANWENYFETHEDGKRDSYPKSHVDGVLLRPTIEVDGKVIMVNGKFQMEQLEALQRQ